MKERPLEYKVNKYSIALLGNRITAMSIATTITGLSSAIYNFSNGIENLTLQDTLIDTAITFGGIFGMMVTGLGTATYESFVKTDPPSQPEKLKTYYKARIITSFRTGSKFFGWCEEQGLYLAAKSTNTLKYFEEARKEVSTIVIPHF